MYFSEIFKKLNLRIGEKKRKYVGIFRIFLQISNSSSSYRFICLISFVCMSFVLFLWVMWLFQLQSILGSSSSLLWIRRRFYLFIAIKYLFLYVFLILFCASSQSVIFCLCKSSMHSRKTSAFSSQNAVKPVAGL